MPEFEFGEKLSIDKGGLFIELKAKNDRLHCRFIRSGYYDGKHFLKENDKVSFEATETDRGKQAKNVQLL